MLRNSLGGRAIKDLIQGNQSGTQQQGSSGQDTCLYGSMGSLQATGQGNHTIDDGNKESQTDGPQSQAPSED
jgi:hypothetical protein